jgi:hypothetical protein
MAGFLDWVIFQAVLALVLIALTFAFNKVYKKYFPKKPEALQAEPENWKKQFDEGGDEDEDEDQGGYFAKLLAKSTDGAVIRKRTKAYEWCQSGTEMDIWVYLKDVPNNANLRGKDVTVDISPQNLRIQVAGAVLLEGELHGQVIMEECTWQLDELDGERVVWITLYKNTQLWPGLLKGDAEVDLSGLGPPVYAVDAQDPHYHIRHCL